MLILVRVFGSVGLSREEERISRTDTFGSFFGGGGGKIDARYRLPCRRIFIFLLGRQSGFPGGERWDGAPEQAGLDGSCLSVIETKVIDRSHY